jgi:hypothetical protein
MATCLSDLVCAALRATWVRAWRLHLDTPGVRATVPMLRGVWGAALKQLSEPLYEAIFVGGEAATPRYVMRPAPPEARPSPAIEFLLFTTATDEADSVAWDAWDQACLNGLGPDRTPFTISSVRPLAWDGTPLAPGRVQPGFALHPLPWPAASQRQACRLAFSAPLRLNLSWPSGETAHPGRHHNCSATEDCGDDDGWV